MSGRRYVCVHGHFYQPPREDPTTGRIEAQPSARPYHDWNERINAECYAANARAPILDDAGRVARRVNNYERISFNFGPTLLSWMSRSDPATYRALLRADRESRSRFSGHGSALAQAYNHAILPLCNERDRRTQLVWGIEDFRFRFGRAPEGIWLPETAVDLDSLEAAAELGLRFSILSPAQALRFRPLGEADWIELPDAGIDFRRAYRVRLPSGESFELFFYDGPIAQAIAFQRLLHRGADLVERLLDAFDGRESPQLVHVATDGETYGHHHAHGEMALAWALDDLEQGDGARLTNYGEFLALAPPRHEVELRVPSSWSCPHGVDRWSAACGCGTASVAQSGWRAPLRRALDALRDRLARIFEERGSRTLHDPWRARDAYIHVVLDDAPDRVDAFLGEQLRRDADAEARRETQALLEMQRHALLMYTSCGWFFEDVSRIETVQILRYAARAARLAEAICGEPAERELIAMLADAKSNDPRIGDAARLYRRRVLDR